MKCNSYLADLELMIRNHCDNEFKQQGKSDIEPDDYIEITKLWYNQIFDFVKTTPPLDFVRAIDVFQDVDKKIKRIEYIYRSYDDCVGYLAINIFNA